MKKDSKKNLKKPFWEIENRKTKKRDDLEVYRQMLDETLKNLRKIYESKYNKINPIQTMLGILVVAIGGVTAAYFSTTDVLQHEAITFEGAVGIFVGIAIAFIGYITAHRGCKGSWL